MVRSPLAASWALALALGLAPGVLACSDAAAPPTDASRSAPTAAPPASVTAPARFELAVRPGYAPPSRCADCHAGEAAAWQGSHHDRAMEVASPDSVLAAFDGQEIAVGAERFRPRREGDRYVVEIDRAGQQQRLTVAYTFGVAPLQQYLVPGPRGRFFVLPIAWDARSAEAGGSRWILPGAEPDAPPGDAFHWTGVFSTWNAQCADCHSTGLEKRYDATIDRYETSAVALDVSCQACHGPGAAHVAWADAAAAGEAAEPSSYATPAEIDACGPCHSRRRVVDAAATPGAPYAEHHDLATLTTGLYHPDGQIDDEVYVLGSFAQSRMHRAGVACGDCHDPHGLGLVREGNALCTGCHSEQGDTRFPAAWGRFDDPSHHFHPEGGDGAACVSCHMAEKVYMGVDGRRDHSFRLPRPDLAEATGAPDACTGCHEDRSPDWAAAEIEARFGPERRRDPHYGEIFAAGRRALPAASAELARIAADPNEAAIVRASAVELLVAFGPDAAAPLRDAVKDPSPWVRAAAARASDALPPPARPELLGPLLTDPVRSVRDAAAFAGHVLPAEDWPDAFAEAARDAFLERQAGLEANRDLPEARLQLALLAEQRGRIGPAEREYRQALRIAPGFVPAAANLSVLLNAAGRNADALAVLDTALESSSRSGELHYSRGLLRAETGSLDDAIADLRRASELLPVHPRVLYNLGIAESRRGRRGPAEEALIRARNLAPQDPSILYALAAFYVSLQEWERALPWAEQLVSIVGEDPAAVELRDRIVAEMAPR